jgi:hypothetical protein
LLGNPFGNTSGRRLYAFCQHFALTYVERTGAPLDPWGECQRVLDDTFGRGLEGVGQALQRNPAALAGHVAHNLVHYPLASLGHLVGGSREGVLPGPGRVLSGWLHALLLALALWQGVRLGAHPGQLPALLARPGVRRAGAALAVFVLPPLASCLLIYPRQHYLPVQTALGLAFLAVLVSDAAARRAPQPERQGGLAVALLAGLLVVSVPRLAEAARPPPGPLHHRTVVRLLASPSVSALLPKEGEVGVLEVQNGYASYLGPRFRQVYLPARPGGFAALLEEGPVHLVVLDAALRADRRLVGDVGFAAFVQRPADFGFVLLEVPGTHVRVAVRG